MMDPVSNAARTRFISSRRLERRVVCNFGVINLCNIYEINRVKKKIYDNVNKLIELALKALATTKCTSSGSDGSNHR